MSAHGNLGAQFLCRLGERCWVGGFSMVLPRWLYLQRRWDF